MNRCTLRFIHRKPNDQGIGTVALQIFVNKTKYVRSTGIRVHSCNWDAERQCVISKARTDVDRNRADELNSDIENDRLRFSQIVRDAKLRGIVLTKAYLAAQLDNAQSNHCFHTWAQQRIQNLVGDRAPRTIDHYRVSFRRLQEFMPSLTYADLTPELPKAFESWLKKRGLKVNARAKYHKHLKTFTRELAHTVPLPDIYSRFPVRQVPGNRAFLTRPEVQLLTNLHDAQVLGSHLQAALRMFLFSCHTGLRFQDLITVTHAHIQANYLSFMPLKTRGIEKRIDVPLTTEALRFINNTTGTLFDKISNAHYGRLLKEIARLADIPKQLSSHVGRHTMGTGYISNGGNVHVLQRIMGHSKIDTTMIYVHMSKLQIEQERSIIEHMFT